MSKITRDDVLKLAKLSRLTLTDNEVEQFAAEMSAILQYVEQLQSADVKGLEPTYQVTGLKNVMRPDEEKSYGPDAAALLKNAPATEKAHFKVKRMIV
ncbi:Asp-tRNA(Asn)/Glu-tRNA(Gln) amidotransferase subunit GatC [Candidatus Saccharibacteria bacterium]|nr:Asp-tRNA(Asn)/Glu-tRNA(Gln) amidotransferase subunit GatC [Candidatus Saccharibacteria bacterium]